MKVALVADSIPVLHGESALLSLLSAAGDSSLDLVPVCPVLEPVGLALEQHGFSVVDLPFKKADSPFQVADLLARFWSIVTTGAYDCIYALSPRGARYGLPISQFTGIPFVYHAFTRRSRGMQALMKRFADGIVCSSRHAADGFSGAAAPVEVIRDGVAEACIGSAESAPELKKKWGLDPDSPVVGMVTDFAAGDDPEMIIRIFRQVLDEIPRCSLVVTGFGLSPEDYARQQHLSRVIRSLDLQERVVARRFFPHFAEWNALIDVLVVPSEREDVLFLLIESAAAGVPVIAARTAWTVECVEDGTSGILVTTGSERGLRQALAGLLLNQSVLRDLSAAGKALGAERFLAARTRAQLTRFLRRLPALEGVSS